MHRTKIKAQTAQSAPFGGAQDKRLSAINKVLRGLEESVLTGPSEGAQSECALQRGSANDVCRSAFIDV
jgi:hypothetical protein